MTESGGTDGLLDRDRLATLAPGAVLLPGTEDYEARRRPVGGRFSSVRPAAIVRCRTALDVASALPAAQHAGLALAVRSGGHDFAGRSTTTGVVIDLGGLNGATVEGTRLTVGAGARLGDLHRVLDPHGRAVPTGCGATVGIAGLSLGGGLGILGRSAGLTCDSLVAAEVVLADGRIVRCDEHRHGNLFWALRGGGAAGDCVA